MDTLVFLDHVQALPSYSGQIAHMERVLEREPKYGQLAQPLHPDLDSRLEALASLPLYSHQAQAINAAQSGRNTFVVTPAASGKTLCYNVPLLDRVLKQQFRAVD